MKDYIVERARKEAIAFLEDRKETIRSVAKRFHVSKSTVHKDFVERLPKISPQLAEQVREQLEYHKRIRHLNAGEATKCEICKREIEKSSYMHAVLCSSECFDRHFWNEKVSWMLAGDVTEDGGIVVRCQGVHYVIESETSNSGFRGFSGHKLIWKFLQGPHKGKVILSTNVWCQGDIPQDYKDVLTDNACLAENEEPTHVLVGSKLVPIEEWRQTNDK